MLRDGAMVDRNEVQTPRSGVDDVIAAMVSIARGVEGVDRVVADAGHCPGLDVVVQGLHDSWAALEQTVPGAVAP